MRSHRQEGPPVQPVFAGRWVPIRTTIPPSPLGASCTGTVGPLWWVGLAVAFATLPLWPSVVSSVLQVPRPETIRSSVIVSELLVVVGWLWRARRLVLPTRVHPAAAILFVGWAVAATAATVAAPHPVPAALRSAEWASHVLFGAVLWNQLHNNAQCVAALHRAVAIGFAIVTGLIVARALFMADAASSHNWMHHVPFLGHARHFGIYAFTGLTFATHPLLDPTASRRSVRWAVGGMTLAWGVLFWTGGRASVGAALIVGCVLWGIARERRGRVAKGFGLAAAIGALLCLCFPVEHGGGGIFRILGFGPTGDASAFTSGRTELWATALAVWRARPWLGIGPDASVFLLSTFGHVQPHNLVVQALVEWGIVGCATFLALWGRLLYIAWIGVRRERDHAVRAGRAVSAAYLFGATAHAMLDGLFYDPRTLFLLTVAATVALRPVGGEVRVRTLRFRERTAVATGVLILIAACGLHLAAVRAVSAPGIPPPHSVRVELLKTFPSPMYLRETARWADAWADEHPEEALEMMHWGALHARYPWFYLRQEGDFLRQRGLRTAALERYERARRLELDALRFHPGGRP